jgi:hypothetical protein
MKIPVKGALAALLCGFLLISCTSSKNLYDQGDYYEAVMRSVEKLRKNPNHKNSREVLSVAYPSAVNYFTDRMETNANAGVDFQFTKEVAMYKKLNAMYEHIRKSPAAQQVIDHPIKYYSNLERVRPLAAEEQYQAGQYHLEQGDRENAKRAYKFFSRANDFVPGYREVDQKMEMAYNRSILHVLTKLQPVNSRAYKLSADQFYTQVNNTLKRIEQNEFIRFYTPEEAKRLQMINPDQVLEIRFEDFVVGETHTREIVETVERDSVKVGEVTLDGGRKRDVIGSVKADLVIKEMAVVSKGLVSMSISNDPFGEKELVAQDFPGEFVWSHQWGKFNGDERALTEEQMDICSREAVVPAPPQQLFVEFTKPIHQQLNYKLLNFYRDY